MKFEVSPPTTASLPLRVFGTGAGQSCNAGSADTPLDRPLPCTTATETEVQAGSSTR